MAKVLLVEDDVNLREIYAARLQSEGYDTLTADDGENALAIAVKEKPDLIILDVMMPKISGFDVLDILRSTPETKNAKIMMMTALSQDGDKERGEKLGANRYLVKSQVTLEDMVGNVKQLLEESGVSTAPQATTGVAPANPPAPVIETPAVEPAAPVAVTPETTAPSTQPVVADEAPVAAPQEPAQAETPVTEPVVSEPQMPQLDPVAPAAEPPTMPMPNPPAEPEPLTAPEPTQDPSAPQLDPPAEPTPPAPVINDDIDDAVIATPGTVIQPTTEPTDQNQS